MIKENTVWLGHDHSEFLVLHLIELDGHRWVHYRDNQGKEYSCYEEAFVQRFSEHVNKHYGNTLSTLAR
jgi:hypothetical protein